MASIDLTVAIAQLSKDLIHSYVFSMQIKRITFKNVYFLKKIGN